MWFDGCSQAAVHMVLIFSTQPQNLTEISAGFDAI